MAYLDGDPIGWCGVEPRPEFPGLHHSPVPWEGRDEDRADDSVWAITCVFARAGHRRRGVSKALIRAALDFARAHGARALEAYPMTTTAAIAEELHHGTIDSYVEAGFVEVGRPSLRRAVVRIEFTTASSDG